MTLCMAGECVHEGKYVIVTMTDSQSTSPSLKTNDAYKYRHIGTATILVSGDMSDAQEMAVLLKPLIEQYDALPKGDSDWDIRGSKFKAKIERICEERKSYLINQHLRLNHGISFEHWLTSGRNIYPVDKFKDISNKIEEVSIGCELIVCYVQDSVPNIFTVLSNGKVYWSED